MLGYERATVNSRSTSCLRSLTRTTKSTLSVVSLLSASVSQTRTPVSSLMTASSGPVTSLNSMASPSGSSASKSKT